MSQVARLITFTPVTVAMPEATRYRSIFMPTGCNTSPLQERCSIFTGCPESLLISRYTPGLGCSKGGQLYAPHNYLPITSPRDACTNFH